LFLVDFETKKAWYSDCFQPDIYGPKKEEEEAFKT